MLSAYEKLKDASKLNYEKYSLRGISLTFKQQSVCKSFIANNFDENTLKMITASPIYVIKNEKQCFPLFLDWTCSLVFHACFSL